MQQHQLCGPPHTVFHMVLLLVDMDNVCEVICFLLLYDDFVV